jgi:hypothetical protein
MRRLQGVPTPWRRGTQNRGLSWGVATLSPRGATPMSGVGSGGPEGGAEGRSPRAPEFIWPNSSHVIQ